MLLRSWIPSSVKLQVRIWRRNVRDLQRGIFFQIKHAHRPAPFAHTLSLSQKILSTETLEAKCHNLHLATQKMHLLVIESCDVFSFWKIVGKPDAQNGFQKSRNLIQGRLATDYGGGLCQLSGIIYHLALMADLEIIERHPHSIDLYHQAERYSPLGADATVVYGYKDLRIRNPFSFPIQFSFEMTESSLLARLHTPFSIPENSINFVVEYKNARLVAVTTTSNGNFLASSSYKIIL
jgi:vancomycin resistance protein VanW